MGTPEFAVVSLERLIDENYEIVGVYTQPDKPRGRGYKLESSPVKKIAEKYNIPLYQPGKLRDGDQVNIIKEINPDLIVVVAYGQILSKDILDIPKFGCVNVHGSLLPKYRGAAPVQWSVINGDKITGVTTMFMDEGLDTGDMILRSQTEINEDETSGELMDRLAVLGANVLVDTVKGIEAGKIKREKQDDSRATIARSLDKSNAYIDFSKSASEIHNLIRGLNPWPVARIKLDGKILKIYRSRVVEGVSDLPGKIVDDNNFVIACGRDGIELLEVQIEGGKKLSAADFLRGRKIEKGNIIPFGM